jgi:HD-like signal output (HDOD) protein
MEAEVAQLLKRSAVIPSLPEVATRFLEIVQDPEFDYQDAVQVISTDAGTASEILRLANSSLFGVTRQVSSLGHAMALLGVRRVRSLVLGRYVIDSIDQRVMTRIDTNYYWRRSLVTAVLSTRFANVLGSDFKEDALISGLLADVGVIVLDEVMPEAYREAAAEYRAGGRLGLELLEQSTVGFTHGEASAIVLEHWQLPAMVCEAVRWHPWEMRQPSDPPTSRIVGAADALSKYLSEDQTDFNGVLDLIGTIQDELRIKPDDLKRILVEVEFQVGELSDMLRLRTAVTAGCNEIAEAFAERQEACSSCI